MSASVAIIDSGGANIASLRAALTRLGAAVLGSGAPGCGAVHTVGELIGRLLGQLVADGLAAAAPLEWP